MGGKENDLKKVELPERQEKAQSGARRKGGGIVLFRKRDCSIVIRRKRGNFEGRRSADKQGRRRRGTGEKSRARGIVMVGAHGLPRSPWKPMALLQKD